MLPKYFLLPLVNHVVSFQRRHSPHSVSLFEKEVTCSCCRIFRISMHQKFIWNFFKGKLFTDEEEGKIEKHCSEKRCEGESVLRGKTTFSLFILSLMLLHYHFLTKGMIEERRLERKSRGWERREERGERREGEKETQHNNEEDTWGWKRIVWQHVFFSP